jgi:hypothetical protein
LSARSGVPEKQAQFDNLMKKFGEFEGGIFQFLSNAIKPQSGSPSIGATSATSTPASVNTPLTPSTNFPLPKPTFGQSPANTSSSNLFGSSASGTSGVFASNTPSHPATSTPKVTEGLFDEEVIPSSQN